MPSQDFYDEVIGTLGGTLVDVELENTDIDLCFKKAKRIYKQKGHNNQRLQYLPVDVTQDVRTYNVPSNIVDMIRLVRPSTGGFNIDNTLSLALYNELFNAVGTTGSMDFLTYELTLQLGEQIRRYSAEEIPVVHDKFANTMTFIGQPASAGRYFLECYTELTDAEYEEVEWIVRWSIAEAKEMLGNAYRKFSGVAAPTGETALAGSEMINEAKQEKEQLLEDILNFVDGEADYMQIVFG